MDAANNKPNIEARAKLMQVKVSIDPQIAAAFKSACADTNVSMAAELSRFMSEYANGTVKRKAAPNYSTRRHRRTAIKAIIKELEQIRACEERVRDRTPDNLQESSNFEATENAISALDEGIDILNEF